LALLLGGFLLCAASDPPPPPALAPYIKDGRFDPGDFGWMKGRFTDATPEDRQAFISILQWHNACLEGSRTDLRQQLAEAGYSGVDVTRLPPPADKCSGFQQFGLVEEMSFTAFQQELAVTQPIANAYLAAVKLAEEAARPAGNAPTLARQLEARTIAEQTLRLALPWSQGMRPNSPKLSPAGRMLLQSQLSAVMMDTDHANTQWLKRIIAEHGWPPISQVGPEASNKAWLLVQHADADPLFQLQALRLMEPLLPRGEVSRQNYAYLYDRIMLKLAGKQRYGTQVMCTAGVRSPLPLEDEPNVNRLRAEMDLPSVAEYIEGMNRNVACEALPENNRQRLR